MSKSSVTMIVLAVSLFVLSLAIFGFMFFQVNNQGQQLSEQISTLEAERAQEDSFFRLQKISEDTTTEREKVRSYFLASESSSIDFLNLVESLAPEAGVTLSTDSLEVFSDPSDNTNWIQVAYTYSASRERVESFLKILETLPYVLRVQSYSMNNRSAGEWQAQVTVRVQILDYD